MKSWNEFLHIAWCAAMVIVPIIILVVSLFNIDQDMED